MICKPCACAADINLVSTLVEEGAAFEDVEHLLGGCDVTNCKGHEDCKGCDCQHKPVKDGQILSD